MMSSLKWIFNLKRFVWRIRYMYSCMRSSLTMPFNSRAIDCTDSAYMLHSSSDLRLCGLMPSPPETHNKLSPTVKCSITINYTSGPHGYGLHPRPWVNTCSLELRTLCPTAQSIFFCHIGTFTIHTALAGPNGLAQQKGNHLVLAVTYSWMPQCIYTSRHHP